MAGLRTNCPRCNSEIVFVTKYKQSERDSNQVIRYFNCTICEYVFELDSIGQDDYRKIMKQKKRARKIARTNRLRANDY